MTRLASATRWLERLVAMVCVLAIAAVVVTALMRVSYPFELEWLEGWCRECVWRVRSGLALYVPPSVSFAPLNYPPLYFWLAAGLSRLVGEGFTALRLVSALSSAGCMLLVAALVKRETSRGFPALVAAGLFAASSPWHAHWFDIARPDALHTLLLLGSVAALRLARAPVASGALAGALLALAFFTKQSAVVAVLPLALLLALTDRVRAAAFAASATTLVLGGLALLDRATHGWHGWYVFGVAAAHRPTRALLVPTLRGDLAPLLPLLALVAWGLWRAPGAAAAGARTPPASRLASRLASPPVFWAAAATGPLASGLYLRLYPGGWSNVLLPAAAFLAICGGLAFHAGAGASRGRAGLLATAALLVQFALFAWDPRSQWPTRADREAGESLVRTLRAVPGGVYVPAHPYLVRLAGKDPAIHELSLLDILAVRDSSSRALEGELRASLASERWRAAVLDHTEGGEWLYELVAKEFPRGARLDLPPGAFWCVTGARTRPETVHAR